MFKILNITAITACNFVLYCIYIKNILLGYNWKIYKVFIGISFKTFFFNFSNLHVCYLILCKLYNHVFQTAVIFMLRYSFSFPSIFNKISNISLTFLVFCFLILIPYIGICVLVINSVIFSCNPLVMLKSFFKSSVEVGFPWW